MTAETAQPTVSDTTSGMLRSNLVVGLGTALSRVTGLIRVSVFAIVLGQRALADAYNSANSSPNAVYELLLGGVLSASLVPMFTRHAAEDDEEATSTVVTVAIIALLVIAIVAVIAAPWIFHLYSLKTPPGIDPALYRRVGTLLARVFLIQIFFYGLSALGSALLQARRRYFAAAWSPVLSNLVVIVTLVRINQVLDKPTVELGDVLSNDSLRYMLWLGATGGIAVMALALAPALKAAKVPSAFRPNFRHPAVKQLLKLSGWTLGYVLANQISLIVIQNLAQGTGEGKQDAYMKAFTFFVLPHGLLGVTIATTFLPEMVRMVLRKNKAQFIEQSSMGIRMVALLTLPAGFGLFVLRRPLVGGMLQHGKFGPADTLLTSRALAGFALGLVGFSVYLFVLRCFYAHQDARTPFMINLVENGINIVLAWVLVDRFGVLGLGLSFAIAYLVSATWALLILSYKVPGFVLKPLFARLGKMLLAAVIMAETVWFVANHVGANAGNGAATRLIVGTIVGIVVYPIVLLVLGSPEVVDLQRRVFRRRVSRA